MLFWPSYYHFLANFIDNPNISKEEALAKAEFEKAEIEKNSMNGLGVSTKTNG